MIKDRNNRDLSACTEDDVSNSLNKLHEINELLRELGALKHDNHVQLVKTFVDQGDYEALQVKPNILRRYM